MNFLVNFLISRGVAKGPEIVSKLVRHGMTSVGGYLVAHSLASPDDVNTLTAGALVLGGIIWSVARTFLGSKVAPGG